MPRLTNVDRSTDRCHVSLATPGNATTSWPDSVSNFGNTANSVRLRTSPTPGIDCSKSSLDRYIGLALTACTRSPSRLGNHLR